MTTKFSDIIRKALDIAKVSKAARKVIDDLFEHSGEEASRQDFLNALSDGVYLDSCNYTDKDEDAIDEAYSFIESLGRDVTDEDVLSYVSVASDDWPKGYNDWGSTEFWISHLQTEEGRKALRDWLDMEGFKAHEHAVDEAISLACSELRNAAEAVGNDSVADAVRHALDLDNL